MTMLYRITLLRSAKRFHVATVCFLLAALSANGVMVIGCGPGKSGSKRPRCRKDLRGQSAKQLERSHTLKEVGDCFRVGAMRERTMQR
jgi:hypothetical protein